MTLTRTKTRSRTRPALAAGLLGLAFLSGCVPATTGDAEGIGFRQARFQEISAMRSYRTCVDDALKVAEDAKTNGHTAAYQTSARILEKCEADLGPEAANLAQEERMRAYSVSILNYVKAGDMDSARRNLETFKSAFAGYDLYLDGGASFIDTAELLVTNGKSADGTSLAMRNVSQDMRMEVERVQFWKRN